MRDTQVEIEVRGATRRYGYIKDWAEAASNPAVAGIRENPHRFSLGRVALDLRARDGSAAQFADISATRQTLDLWTPNGLTFATPSAQVAANVLFTSQWDNYPKQATVPLQGRAGRAFLLMAGSTSHMQSRIDNGEVIVTYTDGTRSRLALRNPESWWPIEQDYFIDDYQFPYCGPLPLRVDLKSARVRVIDSASLAGTIDGGAATVLTLPLDRSKDLKSLELRALANEVVLGLLGVTLDATLDTI